MNLLKATGTIGGLTLISRVLGLVRDSLFAWAVGASFASDAFLVAFRLPNMFRALFAEGAFASAFVPMFNQKVADPEGAGLSDGLTFAEQGAEPHRQPWCDRQREEPVAARRGARAAAQGRPALATGRLRRRAAGRGATGAPRGAWAEKTARAVVELRGIEPLTSSLRTRRSPN